MNWSSRWSLLRVLIFILLKCGTTRPMVASEETSFPRLIVAASHTALSGDLGVLIIEFPSEYQTTSPTTPVILSSEEPQVDSEEDSDEYSIENSQIPLQDPFVLRVLRLDGFLSELVGEVPVEVPAVAGVNVSLMIPCGLFSRGGTYSLQLQHKSAAVPDNFADIASVHDAHMRASLDVRWPTPSLALEPQHLDTYPSQPVLATLEYTGISCAPAAGVPEPTFSVQLIYCGTSVLSCDPRNKSNVQMLYSEEVKGFPAQRVVTLRCEFFGLAGHYALRLKPTDDNPSAPTTSAYIKVEWSDLFVFNVHARSIYPCDGGSSAGSTGVSVLFEYPACRLAGDRVRVYGRLRADVASLAPPSSLHYVAELKAPPGKHTLTFDCDLFTERYVEYCFVYISQAYSGAMSEVRVDCIPTFPLQEGDAGGWGQWSQWTPCSSSCVGGTRNRHRFCDTPPPRYGAKFCQGEAVETEACGGSTQLDLHGQLSPGDWECRHGEGLAADRPEVTAEVGAKCRCGCSLKIESEEQRSILAASSHLCPGRSFWLVQTQPSHALKLYFDQARFSCTSQYVRVRDGDSLIDELLADIGVDRREPASGQITTSGSRLLLEFYNEETAASEDPPACIAGFLAHVTVTLIPISGNATTATPALLLNPKVVAASGRWALWFTPAHLVATSLLILTFLASVFLALQYAYRYRKYHVAEDLDSLTDNSACSGSMQGITRRTRVMSSSTLISEVVSLVRLPKRHSPKHARLAEASVDVEEGYESTETQPESSGEEEGEEDEEDEKESSIASGTLGPNEEGQQQGATGSQRTLAPSSSPARGSSESSGSTATLAAAQAEVKYARPVKLRTFGPISPVSEEAASTSEDGRRFSVTSASNSLNNGLSSVSSSSNSTLRRYIGKESKERRNRERLLQGPGSECSLANLDIELELDYYDYNVTNAGAAPGSYLGMDPAFLVWIPPLSENEADAAEEGASLSPEEYQQRRLHDQVITEYKTRLGEGLLPLRGLLGGSRRRLDEEPLSGAGAQVVVPNRMGSPRQGGGGRLGRRRPRRPSRARSTSSSGSSTELDTPGSTWGRELNAAQRAPEPGPQPRDSLRMSEFPGKLLTAALRSPEIRLELREPKQSFYDLIGEAGDAIKFADDDEYLDNKAVA